ncbi:MAG: hypothetical protein ACW960_12165 [Candidatus Thorarchaeota archaeon]
MELMRTRFARLLLVWILCLLSMPLLINAQTWTWGCSEGNSYEYVYFFKRDGIIRPEFGGGTIDYTIEELPDLTDLNESELMDAMLNDIRVKVNDNYRVSIQQLVTGASVITNEIPTPLAVPLGNWDTLSTLLIDSVATIAPHVNETIAEVQGDVFFFRTYYDSDDLPETAIRIEYSLDTGVPIFMSWDRISMGEERGYAVEGYLNVGTFLTNPITWIAIVAGVIALITGYCCIRRR